MNCQVFSLSFHYRSAFLVRKDISISILMSIAAFIHSQNLIMSYSNYNSSMRRTSSNKIELLSLDIWLSQQNYNVFTIQFKSICIWLCQILTQQICFSVSCDYSTKYWQHDCAIILVSRKKIVCSDTWTSIFIETVTHIAAFFTVFYENPFLKPCRNGTIKIVIMLQPWSFHH